MSYYQGFNSSDKGLSYRALNGMNKHVEKKLGVAPYQKGEKIKLFLKSH